MVISDDEDYDILIEEASNTITYIGRAARKSGGNDTSKAVWQIYRISDDNIDCVITWANGINNFEFIWDNRASYTY